jgi:hypothetical protein
MMGGALLMAFVAASARPTFYVSTKGTDQNDGSLQKPFLTVQRALASTRRAEAGARIVLRQGTYYLPQAIHLTSQDDGLTIEAYGKEHPTLSGGMRLRFQEKDGQWRAALPVAVKFCSLYVNGERRYRPRLPKTGYYNVEGPEDPTPASKGKGFDRFQFKAGDIKPEWAGGDEEIVAIHIWEASRLRIKSVDGNVVTFTGPTISDAYWSSFQKGGRYLVDNAPGALSPGEWRIEGQEVVYRPFPGEKVASAEVVAPLLDRLLTVDQAQNVTIRGVSLRYANWALPAGGRSFYQAAVDLPAAIQVRKSVGVKLIDCEVGGVDGYAIELGQSSQGCEVSGCRLIDLGAGGIKIGTLEYTKDESFVAGNNVVKENLIAHGGRLYPAGVGVWIGHSPHNTVQHNEIADFYYTGISVGWSWGYGASNAHDNTIARNLIHRIGQGVLSDMGGVYLLGVAPGTTVKENLIHDVESYDYGGWGIYPDEGSSNLLIEGNVVYGTKSPGYHQHYGKDNVVKDNVFAMGREAEIRRTREEDHNSFTFEHNIVYWTGAPLLDGSWSNNHYSFDHNLYWRTDGRAVDFAGMSLAQWQAKGRDVHSLIEDPLFVDPAHGNYRLKPDSPAGKLGYGLFEEALDAWKTPFLHDDKAAPAFPTK